MPSAAQARLPGVGSPAAEQAISLLRSMFKADEIRDPETVGAGVYLWDCAFDQSDRRGACWLAHLPLELAHKDWRELSLVERTRILGALHRVELWTRKFRHLLDRLHAERGA